MAGIPIATIASIDSGGSGSCNTSPLVLGKASSSGVGKVYAGKQLVVKKGDVFKPAPGLTPPDPIPRPCASPRILKSSSKVKVLKLSVGRKGDILNAGTNIRIAKVFPPGVYVV